MFLVNEIQNIVEAGTTQLLEWITQILPPVFLFLIFLNAVTTLIGRARVERLAAKCGSNALLRYMVLPFLSAVVLGNPMAISMGRYLPERYKPAYFASASYHCHTNSGIFQHVNPAELFLWLGVANGVVACGLNAFPLALRYLLAGLVANFVSGYATEILTKRIEKRQGIRLEREVDLWTEKDVDLEEALADAPGAEAVVTASVADSGVASVVSASVADSGAAAASGNADPTSEPGTETNQPEGYRSIRIECGDGGYGGPLIITPTPEKHTVICITGGGTDPEPMAKILELSGMDAVNLSQGSCPDEQVALAIIDCGGTLRCGIYPKKRIPTVNIMATGKSGPLAQYITEDIYVSAVTSACVFPAEEPEDEEPGEPDNSELSNPTVSEISENVEERTGFTLNKFLSPIVTVSKVISVFQQSARDAVRTCLEMILPFMGFAALFIGICKGSGLTEFLTKAIQPMGGSLPGLFVIGILCSIPGLSAVLGAGAVAAQMFAAVIGELIGAGSIPAAMALPALFAINCQCVCDFIPVGLGLTEARPETTQVGIASVTLSRFVTGWLRIVIALIFSIGLYA